MKKLLTLTNCYSITILTKRKVKGFNKQNVNICLINLMLCKKTLLYYSIFYQRYQQLKYRRYRNISNYYLKIIDTNCIFIFYKLFELKRLKQFVVDHCQ